MTRGYDAVVWDWNGTLLDDAALGLAAMDAALTDQGLAGLGDLDAYRERFGFPIREFYRRSGFDVDADGVYPRAADAYLAHFASIVARAPLHEGALATVRRLRAAGVRQVLISATATAMLDAQLAGHADLVAELDEVRGGADAHAPAKQDFVAAWLAASGLDPARVLMVGDTGHDHDIAASLGTGFAWYRHGHQALAPTHGVEIDRLAEVVPLVLGDPPAAAHDAAGQVLATQGGRMASSGGPEAGGLAAGRRPMLVETLLVLGVSLGEAAWYSLLSIVNSLTRSQALGQQTTSLNNSVTPDRPWLDLAYQLSDIAFQLVPAALAVFLLATRWRPDAGVGAALGVRPRRRASDAGWGLAIFVAIGVPGLGLYLGARALGLNTTVAAANLGQHWWTIPVLVLDAAMNGVLEEVVMVGYLFTRWRQVGWSTATIVVTSALLRGCYHLYQGFGGFVGNLVMGLLFGAFFVRTRRLLPLVVAHALLDVASFVGYALLHGHVSWL